jgi:hypothetical protein
MKYLSIILILALVPFTVACGDDNSASSGLTIEQFCADKGGVNTEAFEDDGDGECNDGTEYDNPDDVSEDESSGKSGKKSGKKSGFKSTRSKRR